MINQQAKNALITEFKGSPEAKFFIVKFLSRFPNGSGRIKDLSRFSKKLGFTKPVTTQCISELVRLGLLLDDRHQRGEKPYRFLNLSPELQELAETKTRTPLHAKHMGQLLIWGEEPLRERQHKLTINKRLVLLLLLAHADQVGIVRGISTSKLSRCTGLNTQQVKNNIRLLTQHQYIASTIPGGNFSGTMGKTSSIYKLNLRHSAYGDAQPPGTTLLFLSENGWNNELHEAAQLHQSILRILRKTRNFTKPNTDKETHLANVPDREFMRYMEGRMSGAMLQRLQWEMLDIASLVLSSCLEGQTESSELIKSEISARIFPDLREDTAYKDDILAHAQSIISDSIERITKRVSSLLDQLKDVPQTAPFYQILPMQRGHRSAAVFAIEIGTSNTSENKRRDVRTVLFDFDNSHVQSEKTYAALDEVSTELLHQWGILTKPLKQPELRVPPSR